MRFLIPTALFAAAFPLVAASHGVSPTAKTIVANAPAPSYGTTSLIAAAAPVSDFQPWYPAAAFAKEGSYGGFYFVNNVNPTYAIAPVRVPTGAIIEQLELIGCDYSTSHEIRFYMFGFSGNNGLGIGADTIGSTSDAAAPGCATFRVTLVPSVTVQSGDVFNFVAWMDAPGDSSLLTYGMRALYRLQISPAPLTATFADVPTTHPFHRVIEAMAAAGITSGCGSGNFCPEATVTRKQMAAFLAGALGLHYPE